MWADVVRGWEGQKRGFSCIHTSRLHMPYAIAEHGLTLQTDCYLFASSARPSLIQIFIWIMTLCHTPLLSIHIQHWGEDTVSVAITDSVLVVVVVNNDQDVFFPAILSTSDVSPTTPHHCLPMIRHEHTLLMSHTTRCAGAVPRCQPETTGCLAMRQQQTPVSDLRHAMSPTPDEAGRPRSVEERTECVNMAENRI